MTAAADRHLLFGLLALQNGLIDQVQLVAAFQARTRAKSIALADPSIGAGRADRDRLKEPDFDSLRKRADLRKLVADLEANVGPEATQKDGSPRTAADPSTKGR
jgi:hypothetical protein